MNKDKTYLTNHQSLYNFIIKLYEHFGNEHYMLSEDITQTMHALQSAYIAFASGAPEKFIIGMLLHDIGQIVDPNSVGLENILHATHSDIGYKWLIDNNVPVYVCDIARYHTIAKIVLCEQSAEYYNSLSEASKTSYHIQLQNCMEYDIQKFKEHPVCNELLAARICDDLAKIKNFNNNYLPTFERWREAFYRVMNEKGREGVGDWIKELNNIRNMLTNI